MKIELTDRIVDLYGLGFTGPEIAEKVGCSSRLVYATLDKRGVTRRPRGRRPDPTRLTERKRLVEERAERAERERAERERAMVVMRANGSSMAKIAAHFDVTRQRVHQILSEMGRQRRGCK
jgi:transposase